MAQKVVICGAGFLGTNIAKALANAKSNLIPQKSYQIQISSRNPDRVYNSLRETLDTSSLLPPRAIDVTKPETLASALQGSHVVVSLVGILNGTPEDFEQIQWRGAENVARAARDVGAKLIHFSAIGADKDSKIPYAKTKALGEEAVTRICPDVTIIRPSIVFGPGDGFFARFAQLSQYLPFLPVFGGGTASFQPVYVGDLARAVEIASRDDRSLREQLAGKVIEAGGPDVFTYRQIMELVLRYTNRSRPIISLPFALGMLQGAIMEQLPETLFSVTRAQVEQLKSDNIVRPVAATNQIDFRNLLSMHSSASLTPVYDILPTYL